MMRGPWRTRIDRRDDLDRRMELESEYCSRSAMVKQDVSDIDDPDDH
jgi:hypothetical protein